jgi:predicted secreted protein
MAGSSRTTTAKRAKERARQEKRQEKLQKRAQRKLEQEKTPETERPAELTVTYNEEGQPEGFNFHDF